MKFSEAIKALRDGGIENPKLEARMIFEDLCGKSSVSLSLEDVESPLADEAVRRRCEGEPLQYILGKVSFFREEYFVSPSCLIPRSDTEILVEYATAHLKDGARFLDLCTGSGCVAISTLKNTKNTSAVAVDISEKAIFSAKKNAIHNGVESRVEFINGDALEWAPEGKFDALLCNPPYIDEAVYKTLAREIFYEPKSALVAEDGGLRFYKNIIPMYESKIKHGGFMAFEIGYDQAEAIKEIAIKNGLCAKILKDYQGNDRVAVIDL